MNSRLVDEIEELQVALTSTQNEIKEIEDKWATRNITLEKVIETNQRLEKARNDNTTITQKFEETKKENALVKRDIEKYSSEVFIKMTRYKCYILKLKYKRLQNLI